MPFKTLARFGGKRKEKVTLPSKKTTTVFNVVMENITTRRSIRKFKKADVSDDDIMTLIDAARHAPSAANKESWEFIIVRDPAMKKQLAEAAKGSEWMAEAPVIIIACVNGQIAGSRFGERGLRLYGVQEVACAIENLMLAANAMGLGTCWVGAFSEAKVSILFHCPEFSRPCALIPVGWPDEAPEMPARHDASDFVHLGKYGNTVRKQFTWGHGNAQY